MSPAHRMMAASVNGDGSAFKASPPRALFRVRIRHLGLLAVAHDYVVSGDGQRFLINKLVEDPAEQTLSVVLNWTSELSR